MLNPITHLVLDAVAAHPGQMSPILLAYLLRGERIGRMQEKGLLYSTSYGLLRGMSARRIGLAIAQAEEAGYIVRANSFYPALSLTPCGVKQRMLAQADNLANGAQSQATKTETVPDPIFQAYYRWRRRTALRHRTPAYRILPNSILLALSQRRPQTLLELLAVPGLGKRRAARYQHDLIAVANQLHSQTTAPIGG